MINIYLYVSNKMVAREQQHQEMLDVLKTQYEERLDRSLKVRAWYIFLSAMTNLWTRTIFKVMDVML